MRAAFVNILIVVFALSSICPSPAQPKLKILFTKFGRLKKYEFALNDELQYKLKGERHYLTDRIVALHDSSIILTRDSFGIADIKMIKLKSDNYHAQLFQKIFLVGGIGYPALNLVNNSMNNVRPLLSQNALIITGSFLAASFIINELRIKRIRITKNKVVKVVDIDFENINQK